MRPKAQVGLEPRVRTLAVCRAPRSIMLNPAGPRKFRGSPVVTAGWNGFVKDRPVTTNGVEDTKMTCSEGDRGVSRGRSEERCR